MLLAGIILLMCVCVCVYEGLKKIAPFNAFLLPFFLRRPIESRIIHALGKMWHPEVRIIIMIISRLT